MTALTRSWWRAALLRAAYTVLAALLPLAGLVVTGEVTLLYALSVMALAGVASLATSAAGLPELDGHAVPWWRAVLVRVVKTAGQVAAPVLGSAVLLQDIGWHELAVTVGGAVLVTLIRTVMSYLPESDTGDIILH